MNTLNFAVENLTKLDCTTVYAMGCSYILVLRIASQGWVRNCLQQEASEENPILMKVLTSQEKT